MDRKYYTGEQILDALSEVGVGAGDISEVMSCLGRMPLNNNSTKVNRKNDDLIRRQDAIDSLQKEINKGIPPFDDVMGSIRCGVRLARNIIEDLPSAEPNLQSTCNQLATDCISRKEAIDAIDSLPNCYNGYSDSYDKSYIIGVLEELPSAEPEIIKCKDCKHMIINEKHEAKPMICCFTKMCGTTEPDWFCADGERREDETD